MARANIAGLDYDSPVTEFNVRPAPGTQPNDVLFKAQKGTIGLEILDVQPDNQGTKRPDGSVYQWFKLKFPDRQTGWLRGHVLTIEGDLTSFGYGTIGAPVYAYKLNRVIPTVAPAPTPPAVPAPTVASEVTTTPTPATPAPTAASEVTTMPAPATPAPTTSSEVTTARAPTPVVAPTPTTPVPVAPTAPTTSERCAGTVTAPRGAKLRQSPVTGTQITIMPFDAIVDVLEIRSIAGQQFRWVRVQIDGTEGWTREDLLSYSGNCGRFNLRVTSPTAATPVEFIEYTSTSLYPVPMKKSRFVRGFTGPQPEHPGVDYGGDEGEPMLAGPVGGLVVAVEECKKCLVPGKPSTKLQGFSLGDSRIFSDKDWNFGFGHYIIVRYLNSQLPPQTKQALANIGRPGHHIYAMYAHLQGIGDFDVEVGTVLEANQQFTCCGNSGNSSGPHVHLELRADSSPSFPGWARIKDGLVDPLIMFERD